MALHNIALIIKWLGSAAAALTIITLFYGIWSGLRRPGGRSEGYLSRHLRISIFYVLASLGFFFICVLLWRPLPITLPDLNSLIIGSLLYFTGLALVLWARISLGEMYFVSSSLGAQLYADHILVTHGPYALVRHPIYLGILLAGIGGLLLYQVWTFAVFVIIFPALVVRSRREEALLATEFPGEWEAYCRQVPSWIPRLRRIRFHR